MYKALIRPILFLLSPETVHHLVIGFIKVYFKIPGIKRLIASLYTTKNFTKPVNFLSLTFKHPVGLAAGFDKNASFYNEFSSFGFSFIEIGTVTPKGQPGNPKPRSFRLVKDKAVINRMGFNNLGVDEAVNRLKNRKTDVIIGGNIGKNTATPNEKAVDDYVYVFERLYDYVDYFVVNVSCPNISDLKELQDQDKLEAILFKLKDIRDSKVEKKPILLKLSPDLNNQQLDESIEVVQKTGIDGFVATNTTVTRNKLDTPETVVRAVGNGGLSGKPIRERATEVIQYIHNKTEGKLPIIGVGGIFNAKDAQEKLDAGASLVQVYTGFIYEGPSIVKKILKGLN
jgi:dihydroorotate dehydrogenase